MQQVISSHYHIVFVTSKKIQIFQKLRFFQLIVSKRAAMLLDRLMVALHHALEDEDGNPRKINEVYRDGSFYATTQTLAADKGKLNGNQRPQTSALHQVRTPNHHHLKGQLREQLNKNNKNIVSSSELSSMLGAASDEFSPALDSENGTKKITKKNYNWLNLIWSISLFFLLFFSCFYHFLILILKNAQKLFTFTTHLHCFRTFSPQIKTNKQKYTLLQISLVLYVVVKGNPAIAEDAESIDGGIPPSEFAVGGAELLLNDGERAVNVRNSNNNNNNNEPHHHQGVDETVRRDSNFAVSVSYIIIEFPLNFHAIVKVSF